MYGPRFGLATVLSTFDGRESCDSDPGYFCAVGPDSGSETAFPSTPEGLESSQGITLSLPVI